MKDFTFYNPTRLIFGKSSMDSLANEVRKIGKKVLITYGKGSIKKNGVYDAVMNALPDSEGFIVNEFGGIEPNPRVETIRKAIEKAREFEPDLILAVGGGSVIDGSKLLAAATYYDGDAWDFLIKSDVEPSKYIPLATVLTLSATNSEMNSGAVISNWEKNQKLFFLREPLYPVFSILDPRNTFTLPKDQVAYGVIDPFVHVIEQYITTPVNAPLQDRWAEGALLTLIEEGPKTIEDLGDYESRANIMLIGSMVLNGLLSMGVNSDWATHNIEHELSAFYDITHAAGLAIILPRWMDVVGRVQKPEKMVQYGKRVWGLSGTDEEVINGAITKTSQFFDSLGVASHLGEFGITSEHFDTMVERLASAHTGEIKLTAGQIREILQNSL